MTFVKRKNYSSPSISVAYITMESGFAAGSVVKITVGESGTPSVTDWVERETEQTWNF